MDMDLRSVRAIARSLLASISAGSPHGRLARRIPCAAMAIRLFSRMESPQLRPTAE
jgi:hypothetical protein